MNIKIRKINSKEQTWLKETMTREWGGEPLLIRGVKFYPSSMESLIAVEGEKIMGFMTYEIRSPICEIIAFEVYEKFNGLGTLMLEEMKKFAQSQNCTKLYLMTTNDNLDALRFYQKRGFQISGIHLDSVKNSRKLKPTISEFGDYGIAVRDEIDLEQLI